MRLRSQTISRLSAPLEARTVSFFGLHPIWYPEKDLNGTQDDERLNLLEGGYVGAVVCGRLMQDFTKQHDKSSTWKTSSLWCSKM